MKVTTVLQKLRQLVLAALVASILLSPAIAPPPFSDGDCPGNGSSSCLG